VVAHLERFKVFAALSIWRHRRARNRRSPIPRGRRTGAGMERRNGGDDRGKNGLRCSVSRPLFEQGTKSLRSGPLRENACAASAIWGRADAFEQCDGGGAHPSAAFGERPIDSAT
jgi:hypothetical protein